MSARIAPLAGAGGEPTLGDLIAQGLLEAPRSRRPPEPARPIPAPGAPGTAAVLDELRGDR